MNLQNLFRPEYLARPRNIWNRLWRKPVAAVSARFSIGTTGVLLDAVPNEHIGINLQTFGVYDLVLTEAIFRLLDAGDTALDVGANIGYSASLIGKRIGPNGRALAIEPLPNPFQRLVGNLSLNGLYPSPVQPLNLAASDEAGIVAIQLPEGFELNQGVMSLEKHVATEMSPRVANRVEVRTERLDALVPADWTVDFLKIDVEGHEAKVLAGAGTLIAEKRVRTVFFEEHGRYPTPATQLLEAHGYRLWQVRAGFNGPRLIPPTTATRHIDEPNWIATVVPDEIVEKLGKRRWMTF